MAKTVGNPYENLANAIIVKACDDYRVALRGLRRNPSDRNYMDEALQLERFFHSAWYQELTTVDGDFLIRKIREEIKNGR